MLMDIIKARHSIRKYTDKQISHKDLELILEAGNYAPNAGQRSMMVAESEL
jgi:nitroreductase